jgi:hypothetical protein
VRILSLPALASPPGVVEIDLGVIQQSGAYISVLFHKRYPLLWEQLLLWGRAPRELTGVSFVLRLLLGLASPCRWSVQALGSPRAAPPPVFSIRPSWRRWASSFDIWPWSVTSAVSATILLEEPGRSATAIRTRTVR